MYYAQFEQDKILNERIFKNKNGGKFIEVGAHDGIQSSNCCFFEKELGWTGICFEPIKERYDELLKNRPNSKCYNKCAYSENKMLQFNKIEGYAEMLSGIVENYDTRHINRIDAEIKQLGGNRTIIEMEGVTITSVCNEIGEYKFDFMSLDVEGGELEVLKGIDFNKIKIDVIVIENNYPDSFGDIKKLLFDKGYFIYGTACIDVIFIHKSFNDFKIKLHVVPHWSTVNDISEFLRMSKDGKGSWENIELVDVNTDPDYYVILNYPNVSAEYMKKLQCNAGKILFFHMEPSYFYKGLGFFADPPLGTLKGVFTHKYQLNLFQWHLNKTYDELMISDFSKEKTKEMSAIISSLYTWPGHKLRVDFIKYLENNHPEFKFDLYGKTNDAGFKTYLGPTPLFEKDNGLIPYKYTFNSENSEEKNYATEKIVDAILAETLCFYWGCPNLEDYIDSEAFIRLDLNDYEKSYQIIISSIANNEWEKRLPIIKQMKHRILTELQFFPRIQKLIQYS